MIVEQLGLRTWRFDNADGDDQALEMLRAGKVQAVFTTGRLAQPLGRASCAATTCTLVRFEQKPPPPYQPSSATTRTWAR